MSTFNKINISLICLVAGLAACHDSVTNLSPESELTAPGFYQNAQDLNAAVLGVYSSYQSRLPNDWTMLEMPTDNMHRTGYHNIADLNVMNNLSWSSEANPFVGYWQQSYNGIYRANGVLANLDTPIDYAPDQKEQLEGEAKFMRALFYFDLVRAFGGVPQVTELLSVDEARGTPRSSESEIYTLILDDLEDAYELLPEPGNIASGRANKGAAVALRGKVHIFLEEWDEALTYLEMVDDYNYTLENNFADLWDLENEDNNEVIFAMKYIDGENGHRMSTNFLPYFGVPGIGNGDEDAFPSWDLHKEYDEDDARKEATITEYYLNPEADEDDDPVWYPYISKYAVEHTSGQSGLDLPVLRYADIVLLKAEALFRTDQPGQALIELNEVRERAFGDVSHNYTNSNDFMDKLMHERRLELAFENERWFDLVRTGRYLTELTEVEEDYNIGTGVPVTVDLDPEEYHKYFPIPLEEIDQHGEDVLEQNDPY
ncbi:MAG: RagB/SusD family nutrient uptake outer membrane protein [Balneolales bacterium]